MVSKHVSVLILLVVGATIIGDTSAATFAISNVTDPFIQHMGSFAVEEYNRWGESHLLFKEVFGGYVNPYPGFRWMILYTVHLMAINCTQSGALANYTADVMQLDPKDTKNLHFMGLGLMQT